MPSPQLVDQLPPCHCFSAWCRLICRPAPWLAELNARILAFGRAGQDVRAGPHAAADDHRLADVAVTRRQFGMTRAEGARGALAMHVQQAALAGDRMHFRLAGVVRDVEQRFQSRLRKQVRERSPASDG